MKITVLPASKISGSLAARWAEIQQDNPGLCSPFFRPEFTQAVSAVRDDTYVAVIDDGTAFFPFQRSWLGFGRPIGGAVSDYHGLIAPPGYHCDIETLIRACGLRYWDFDHVPAEQRAFIPWRTVDTESFVVDISTCESPISGESRSRYATKRRKLEREVGRVEVELESSDPEVLRQCIEWKSAQYRQTKIVDLFARPWARALAEGIAKTRGPDFSGMVSVLRAGGRPVAIHFGMRSNSVWHYWFPAYDPEFSRYSPGMLLLLDMMSAAPERGLTSIDFGKGNMPYKQQLSNRIVPLIEGSVAAHRSLLILRRSRTELLQWARQAPLLRFVPARLRKLVWLAEQSGRFR